MKADVLNMQGEKVKQIELPASIFEVPVKSELMHQAYERQRANARLGTHDTKLRGEVAGGGRKPWRQKGTGRARQGSTISAQWIGGGRIHTPHPRSHSRAMPRKMRRAALRSALSAKLASADIIVIEAFDVGKPKTGAMAEMFDVLAGTSSVLVVLPEKDKAYGHVTRAGNNMPDVKILLAAYLNVRDLLSYEKVILPLASLDVIAAHLGGSKA